MKVGKIYRVKICEGIDPILARLQGVSRSVVLTPDDKARHFVEMSFLDIRWRDAYNIKVPFEETLELDDSRVEKIIEAVLAGTQVPQGVPHTSAGPSEGPE